jgi:hypothetical protein
VNGDEAGEQDGRISEPCGDRTRGRSRRLWGDVDIAQASVLGPAGRPRAGFGDGS